MGGNPGATDLAEPGPSGRVADGPAGEVAGKENRKGGAADASGALAALEAAVSFGVKKKVLSLGSVVIDGRQKASAWTFDRNERYQSMRPLYDELRSRSP